MSMMHEGKMANTVRYNILAMFVIILAVCVSLTSGSVSVQTKIGEIIGDVETLNTSGHSYDISVFLGIPYAEPTGGEQRFAKPVKKAAFTSPYYATNDSLRCPSNVNVVYSSTDEETSEDCLYLNVYVPQGQENNGSLPVLVLIHDDQHQVGLATLQLDLMVKEFAAVHDVVVVTFNYRLSAFGFLADPELGIGGNFGLWDQQTAIRWVHDNIEAFGGDPNQVTLFGNSTGAAWAILQGLYPGNQGLFSNIIAQSGAANAYWAIEKYPNIRILGYLREVGCPDNATVVECLRNKTTNELESKIKTRVFRPVVDGDFIKVDPRQLFRNPLSPSAKSALRGFSNLNVVIGRSKYDGLSILQKIVGPWYDISGGVTMEQFDRFSSRFLRDAGFDSQELIQEAVKQYYYDWSNVNDTEAAARNLLDVITDVASTVPIVETITAHVQLGGSGNGFLFECNYDAIAAMYQWAHSYNPKTSELFVDGFPRTPSMSERWAQFVKTGSPNAVSLPIQWKPYTLANPTYLAFESTQTSTNVTAGSNMAAGRVRFWRDFVPRLEDPCKGNIPVSSAVSVGISNCYLLVLIGASIFAIL